MDPPDLTVSSFIMENSNGLIKGGYRYIHHIYINCWFPVYRWSVMQKEVASSRPNTQVLEGGEWALVTVFTILRPNKKYVFRVTQPYINLLLKHRIFFRFSGKNIILCILEG